MHSKKYAESSKLRPTSARLTERGSSHGHARTFSQRRRCLAAIVLVGGALLFLGAPASVTGVSCPRGRTRPPPFTDRLAARSAGCAPCAVGRQSREPTFPSRTLLIER
ncbi:hypothetical protein BC834DRAFT_642813 [Gloeopeniophorella convolvens]|nr:hypothetical protein BC834DRAFT_642813 [Gloeopeniophorella convolvens]